MIQNYPSLNVIFRTIINLDPNQETFLQNSFDLRSLDICRFSDLLAAKIVTLLDGEIETACKDYIWMCENILDEEIYFRRNGEYRIKTINQAIEEIYSNSDYMKRYLNGILVSQVVWYNHIYSMYFYQKAYLSKLPNNSDHLEIGPGHGLLLHLASESVQNLKLTAFDISETSLLKTQQCFEKITKGSKLDIIAANIMDSISLNKKFDSIVMSELLEHLESPIKALQIVKNYLTPSGVIYLNVPINSPAPDHIYLFSTPEEVLTMVTDCGFDIVDNANIPMTGHTLQNCRDKKLTISCLIYASLR